MFDTHSKLTILAIGAHGDDIELACGGSLAKAVKKGHNVIMVVVTGVDSNDHNNISIRDNGNAKKEAKAAAKAARKAAKAAEAEQAALAQAAEDERRAQEEVQKMTDQFIVSVDQTIETKEKDLLVI